MRTRSASRLTTRIGILLLTLTLAWWGTHQQDAAAPVARPETSAAWQQSDDPLLTAYLARSSHVQIESEGIVERLLPDDDNGSRHQRFILKGPSGQTVLVAHNIDLAPRVDDLEVGARITFSGEYEWNERGGVLHWTHHAPRRDHIDGRLEYRGRRYE